MKSSYRRACLLSGASIAAFAFVVPAVAAPAAPGAGTRTAAATRGAGRVLICNIAENCAIPDVRTIDEPVGIAAASPGRWQNDPHNQLTVEIPEEIIAQLTSIDIEPGASASAVAQVSCATSAQCANPGAIVQRATALGSGAVNGVANAGRLGLDIRAGASGSTALASAFVQTGIWQHASGLDASNQLSNDALVDLSLAADAVATLGDALAFANLGFGALTQTAIATGAGGEAANVLANGGSIAIGVDAHASGARSAAAAASAAGGVIQQAIGVGSARASNTLENDGSIIIDLSATAEAAESAYARADATRGLIQTASGGSSADSLVNAGDIGMSVDADARGGRFASALAVLRTAVSQTAGGGSNAEAAISLNNEGSLSLHVGASAGGDGGAVARAIADRAIAQIAGADQASVSMANAGSMDISAVAAAVGGAAVTAYAGQWGGILQQASGGDASVRFDNSSSGTVSIGAAAAASALDGPALAMAQVLPGSSGGGAILQYANGADAAAAGMSNAGAITIGADAQAEAAGTGHSFGFDAIARAEIAGAIQQVAESDGGAASATFVNAAEAAAAEIDLSAVAHAYGQSGQGTAFAGIASGLVQVAAGTSAHALFSNDGAIHLAAAAAASGPVEAIKAHFSSTSASIFFPVPGAKAGITNALVQVAQAAAGTASGSPAIAAASLANSGSIIVSAAAQATAVHTAIASASILDAVAQAALAQDGAAGAALANSGSLEIAAVARASGSVAGGTTTYVLNTGSGGQTSFQLPAPGARAALKDAIRQNVIAGTARGSGNTGGGPASAAIANTGAIDISAAAMAAGDALASALASVSAAINQNAVSAGGTADAAVDNSGVVNIAALASASATGAAFAEAVVGPAIFQDAISSLDRASAGLSNDADLFVMAQADAAGRTAAASAAVDGAVAQAALASAEDAAVSLTNGGSLDVRALAGASGSRQALADAGAGSRTGGAAAQTAIALSGFASDRIENLGSIEIAGLARATATGGWAQAIGHVDNGLVQNAWGASASAELVNSGSIALVGAGTANGASATGDGIIAGGIEQHVAASGSVTKPLDGTPGGPSAGAAATLANSGSISISGIGHAEARGPAAAVGFVGGAVDQHVSAAEGPAVAAIDNGGDIAIAASAGAQGAGAVATFGSWSSVLGGADAFAIVSGGLVQAVSALADSAAADLANSGLLSISALASAEGPGISVLVGTGSAETAVTAGPRATASLLGAVDQDIAAAAGNAEASLANSGTVQLEAAAGAAGGNGPAAEAFIWDAILQSAVSLSSDAAVTQLNSGTLGIVASAGAVATGPGGAFGQATVFSADHQQAQASAGAANAGLDNSGTLTVGALAHASATDQSGRAKAATALANLFGGLVAGAEGSDGASAELRNTGSIALVAAADADAGDGAAYADALATRALQESASGGPGGAQAAIRNSGTIAVGAQAEASAAVATARAHVLTGLADFVSSSGTADALVSNSGRLQVSGEASAVGASGPAEAGAGVEIGVGELVSAIGSASAAIANSATMQFAAVGNAVAAGADGDLAGPAFASAHLGGVTFIGVHGLLSQDVRAGEAEARVDNSGILSATALAAATGTQAIASANVISAARQNVSALSGDALESVLNSGSMLIAATAAADAGAGPATAVATVGNAIDQDLRSNDDARAAVKNSGAIAIIARGEAGGSGDAAAAAIARGVSQSVSTSRPAGATASFDTSGEFSLAGLAVASAGSGIAGTGSASHPAFGSAIASVTGVAQTAAHADFANSGTLAVADSAQASGAGANARAHSLGIVQRPAQGGDTASGAFLNDGMFTVDARAVASGASGIASASAAGYRLAAPAAAFDGRNSGTLAVHASASAPDLALAAAHGLVAGSIATSSSGASAAALPGGGSGSSNLVNSGAIDVSARASGGTAAQALAADGLRQAGNASSVSQAMANSGDIVLAAYAETGDEEPGYPFAGAVGTDAMAQYAVGEDIAQDMGNSGSVAIGASTRARGSGRLATGAAAFTPMGQQATGATVAQTMANDGSATAVATADASAAGVPVDMPDGEKLWGVALVQARALGLGQIANSRQAGQRLSNSGIVNVAAKADAVAPGAGEPSNGDSAGAADAFAFALGAFQSNNATVTGAQSFANAGTFNVAAIARGDAAAAAAHATAEGYRAFAHGFTTQQLALANSGAINIAASAEAHGVAYAEAIGLHVGNAATSSAPYQAFAVAGSLENSGSIDVFARADGDTFTRHSGAGSTAHTYTYGGSSAFATGILVSGGPERLKISNSGVIRADAITTDGGRVLAQGIVTIGNGSPSPAPDDVLTIDNSGDIIVRQSADGGTSWSRGIAISVAGYPERNVRPLPNAAVINLLGGSIYGNIRLRGAGGDVINVARGETSFDGIINPDLAAAGAAGDSGVGTLNIASGGTLYLRDRRFDAGFASMYDGPSFASVGALNVEAGGKLALDLAPVGGGAQAAGSYSQVVAGSASLGGALEVRLATANGLFADSYRWDDVIDAGSRTGEFDSCRLGGRYSGSLLLGIGCSYDSGANVDVTLTRRAFGSVEGLNRNGAAVGSALEAAYGQSPTGPVAAMFGDLFGISDTADYSRALNALGGASYANYLQSFGTLGAYYNGLIDGAVDCGGEGGLAVRSQCRDDAPVRLWGRLGYQSHRADGDSEAEGLSSHRSAALIGADVAVGESGVAGVSAGAVRNHVRGRQFGDEIRADGFQVGAYGAYDPGAYFLKAMATYSRFDGDSRRAVAPALAGGSFASTLAGDPDIALWTLGLHAGGRVRLGQASVLTPYAELDYSRARLGRFDERSTGGSDGVELHLGNSRAGRTMLTGGVKWSARIGGLAGTFDLGYRYRLGSSRATISESLICVAPGCAFDILSARESRGALRAGASLGGRIGPLDVRVSYSGEFAGRHTSHGAGLKLVLPLGAGAGGHPPDGSLSEAGDR